MPGDVELQAIVGALYDAALDRGRWSDTLGLLAQSFKGACAVALGHDVRSRSVTFGYLGGEVSLDAMTAYVQHYVRINPRLDHAAALPPDLVFHDAQFLPERDMDRNEFYADFLRPFGMRYTLGVNAIQFGRQIAGFAVERAPGAGPASEEEVARFRILVPHFQRSLLVQATLAQTEARSTALLAALDRLPLGVILVDGHSRILAMNRAGGQMAAARDGLASEADGLRAASVAATAALRRLVAETARTAMGGSLRGGGELRLGRPSGRAPLALRAVPVGRGSAFSFGLQGPAVALLVSDPEGRPRPRVERLARLYGLTSAQARLLAALARGLTLEEAADQFGLTRGAVRKQRQRLYRKIGARSEGDLVRLALSGPPADD